MVKIIEPHKLEGYLLSPDPGSWAIAEIILDSGTVSKSVLKRICNKIRSSSLPIAAYPSELMNKYHRALDKLFEAADED